MGGGTPKSSIFIGFSTVNHPFWSTLIYGNPHMYKQWINMAKERNALPPDPRDQGAAYPPSAPAPGSQSSRWGGAPGRKRALTVCVENHHDL